MPREPALYRVGTERAQLPPMTFEDTLHWDGVTTISRDGGLVTTSKPTFPSMSAAHSLPQATGETQRQIATGWHARPPTIKGALCPVRSSAPQAMDLAQEAQRLTVFLDHGLLLAAARNTIPGVTG